MTTAAEGKRKTSQPKPPSQSTAKKTRPRAKAQAHRPGPRADFGAPVDGFFAKQPAAIAAVLIELRDLVLVLTGPPGTHADPDGLLAGEGKTGQRLELQPGDTLPRASITGWLARAAARARKGSCASPSWAQPDETSPGHARF